VSDHVLADTGLTDVDAELEQFTVNVGSAPEWIFAAQHTDQLANLTAGRPGLPWRIFHLHRPKPFRCQPISVAGLMIETRASQPFQTEASHAQRKWSAGLNFGRLTER